ncbi:MAG TPA: 3'-5' exonuclease, partial [Blastocatellia bacterium]|nr:3'-5' exonuclease [Blastocatellia bacterium]
ARAKASVGALDYEDLQLGVRALLQTRPDVAARLLARYRYVLVDEFQDTNGLQRDIVRKLGLAGGGTNVFIVGDRKQSIYGFRGAEVEVFGEAIHDLDEHGGMRVPLSENFRSDARLIAFQNGLFTQLMTPEAGRDPDELESLGFVEYETGIAERPASCEGPAVELLLDFPDEAGDDAAVSDRDRDESSREREARLLAQRVREIVDNGEVMVRERRPDSGAVTERPVCFGDFAMLFGATTNAKTYERALRLNKVPYYVVAGKGFYDRPEITDVLNLLGFIDNSSDELALAAVLRSPMFGVSDDTLLALRIEIPGSDPGELHARPLKPLFDAVREHADRPAISDEQHGALDEAVDVLETLLAGRNRMSISRLIAEALERTRYTVVAAAADDGPQRLSNLDKLSSIARQYERGGMRLLRDFVDYVGDFRRLSAREAEANLRSDVNALAILTAHSSKGLEFPVVVLPDLQRVPRSTRTEFAFDRMVGLGFKVPDGRGGRSTTGFLERISARAADRKRFEDQRLLYVAVTRAEEYLILSGASDRRTASSSSWLGQLLAAFETSPLEDRSLAEVSVGGASVKVTWASADVPSEGATPVRATRAEHREARDAGGAESRVTPVSPAAAVARARAMLEPVRPSGGASLPWLSATSLQNFAHCPRQFYFTRLLRVPELVDITAARDDGEREAPDGRLPASLRGLVVHRFCETYTNADDVTECALASLRDVVAERGDVYEDVLATYDEDAALAEVLPFARNYVASALRARIESAAPGDVLSELGFRVDLEHGTISGAIDKLVIERDGPFARAVVIDFKTGGAHADGDFDVQMQAYAVAASELDPRIGEVETVLHFLGAGPDVYVSVAQDVPAARAALDSALETIGTAERDPRAYPTRPGERCTYCRFSPICPDAAI